MVAVAHRDTIFTDGCFGASFSHSELPLAHLTAGILASSLASWYFLMTGSTIRVWIPRLKLVDVVTMPVPNLELAVRSPEGQRVVEAVRSLERESVRPQDMSELDRAVADLYGLRAAERIVVSDGLTRGGWQWKAGKLESVVPADLSDLQRYAAAFLHTMDSWFSVSGRRRMRADIFDLPDAPHRVVRFVIENVPGPSITRVVRPDGSLRAVLEQIGERIDVEIAEKLVGTRELHVHARDEVSVVKPAARRNWMEVRGLDDADAVFKHSAVGDRAG